MASKFARALHWPASLARWRGVLLLLSICIAPVAGAQTTARAGEAEVEAAYLVNFLRYTQWPEPRPGDPQAPYVITVIGSEAAANSVRAVAQAAARVDGRVIEVRRLATLHGLPASPYASAQDRDALAQLRRSHLVFFHQSAGAVSPRVLAELWGQPVLTVSNIPGFTGSGGMLGLVRNSGRVLFEANPVAIRNSHLVVSAKVLKLARRMQGSER